MISPRRSAAVLFVVSLPMTSSLAQPSALTRSALRDVEREWARIESEVGGTLGVAVMHVESGERASLHGGERFPMASVYKLPIAVQILSLVDRGELRLDQKVAVAPSDLRPGVKAFAERAPRGGHGEVDLTLADVLDLAVRQSDNTASDLLLRLGGGPAAVTARMRALDVGGVSVDRFEREIFVDTFGLASPPPPSEWSLEWFDRTLAAVPIETRRAAAARFVADPRDTSTPEAMASLLVRLHRRDLLERASADRLVALMERTTIGPGRLRGLLPEGTRVAHKTGTGATVDGLNVCTNDVGIVSLPHGAGHLSIAVFLKGSRAAEPARERAIARACEAAFARYAPIERSLTR